MVTCHWHRKAAKRQKGGGFREAHAQFLRDLSWAIRTYKPEVLTGDFNMGLLTVAAEMRRQALNVEIACWFAWHGIREGGAIAEEPAAGGGGAQAADGGGAKQTEVEKKIDSCAIFYCQPCGSVKTSITLERFDSDDGLSTYAKGQGYPLRSYIGDRPALEETLRQRKLASTDVETVHKVRGKSVKKEMWDEHNSLWAAGGHMPLMAFIGEISNRKPEALVRREGRMVQRGWGPESWRRSEHMQKLGKGPPPPSKWQGSRDWHRREWSGWSDWQRSDWNTGATGSGATGSGATGSGS